MTTDIANLGTSLVGVSDGASLRSSRTKDLNVLSESGREQPTESFRNTLEKKVSDPSQSAKAKPREPETQNEPVRLARSVTNPEAKKPNNGGLSERQRVMQEFMASMESELGVPPEQIVVALSQLSPRDMLRAPEDTVTDVLSRLNLDAEDYQRAAELYFGMLSELRGLPNPNIAGPGLVESGATLATSWQLSNKDRRESLNRSIDQMNSRFFMRDTAKESRGIVDLNGPGLNGQSLSDPLGTAALQKEPNTEGQGVGSDQKSLPDGAFDSLEGLTPVQPEKATAQDQELLRRLALTSAAASGTLRALEESSAVAKTLQMEQQLAALAEAGGSTNMEAFQTQSSEAGLGDSSGFHGQQAETSGSDLESVGADLKSSGKSTDMFSLPSHELARNGAETAAVRGESVPALSMLSGKTEVNGDQESNIAHIMNQTRYMIKKGGGEAKVTMSPEGMGQLQLKVMVTDGKVNIEMNAETKEAKKLLENSLSDLKSNLQSQRLAVESIKVDVGNRTGSESGFSEQSSHQRQSDMNDSQREQARQAFNMLRDDGMSGRRGAFFETPGYRAYKGKSQTIEPLEPADSSKVQSRRWQGAGRGSSVDLVA